jgi:uracil-DNA glycosylase family 4
MNMLTPTQPLDATHYWTAEQLQAMRGLELPIWYRKLNALTTFDTLPTETKSLPTDVALNTAAIAAVGLLASPYPASPTKPQTQTQTEAQNQNQHQHQIQVQTSTKPLSKQSIQPSTIEPSSHKPLNHAPSQAQWLIVTNEPLNTSANVLWTNILASVGKSQDDTDLMCLREVGSEVVDPFSDEIQRQLIDIQARALSLGVSCVIALGELAAQALLGVDDALQALMQEVHEFETLPLLVLHHPQHILSAPSLKAQVWRDLNRL